MPKLTYDGSLMDHADHPTTFKLEKNGTFERDHKKRKIVKTPWRREKKALEAFPLHGALFPKGKAVDAGEIRISVAGAEEGPDGKVPTRPLSAKEIDSLVAKATALGCFKIEADKAAAKP